MTKLLAAIAGLTAQRGAPTAHAYHPTAHAYHPTAHACAVGW